MVSGKQAIVPKVRGMYSKRLTHAEYEEMMRRRTVPEVAAILRRHPYFERSLASLTSNPHRGQVEELLNQDIFNKYRQLALYDPLRVGFAAYFIDECEATEVTRRLHLLSIGMTEPQPAMITEHLVGHVYTDLYDLAAATSFEGVLEVIRRGRSPYYRVLKAHHAQDPQLKHFPEMEAKVWGMFYKLVFRRIDKNFKATEKRPVSRLFLQQVEGYNMETILRVKTYFSDTYDEAGLRELLLPYRYRIPPPQMDKLIAAPSADAFIQAYRQLPFVPSLISSKPEEFVLAIDQQQFAFAQRLMRISAQPLASLAAFLTLTKFLKEDVVNIVEGVRYEMSPEDISVLLLG